MIYQILEIIKKKAILKFLDYKIESNLVVKTPEMKEIVNKIKNFCSSKANILIQGESGTGKELIAKLIHYTGITRNQPFICINCADKDSKTRQRNVWLRKSFIY
jgi:transcriptional regulator with PAS, ATPase and Fis domain